MLSNILESSRRLVRRVQPISQIKKRQRRKNSQEQREKYYAIESQIKNVRKEMGYSNGHEWTA